MFGVRSMSIRVKLLLSFAAMLIVPLILFVIAALLLTVLFRGDLQNLKDDLIKGNNAVFTEFRSSDTFKELIRTARHNPDMLSRPDYLKEVDGELGKQQAGILVRIGKDTVFISDNLNRPEILGALPVSGKEGENKNDLRIDNRTYSLSEQDFTLSDKRPGSLYYVRAVNPIENFARKFFPVLFFALLVILVATNLILTYLVSKSILRPLRALKMAALQIKEGNLDFQVRPSGNDEIGQLGVAFEEMRVQLKESVGKQLQYEENRKELISNISHDLKTPITAIKGYMEGIRDGVADTPEKMERYMKTISSKAEDMDHLIDELFLYSKLDLNRLPFNFERVDFGAFMADCAEELRFDLEKKGIAFHANLDEVQGQYVSADWEKLKRVIGNIISNCVKFMEKPERKVVLTAMDMGASVAVKIADNGPGIEPEAVPYIFDRFYRTEQSRNSSTGGSGLGLAIAKQIVEGHGGSIWALSEKGQGTSIFFTLKKTEPEER